MALDGAVLQLDDSSNKAVYGKKSVAADAAVRKINPAALAVVQPFIRALQTFVPAGGAKPTSN